MTTAKVTDELIQALVDRLVAEYSPQQVILFGSYAYGTPDQDSDIDLLIIKETAEPFIERVMQAREAIRGLHKGIPLDLFVRTPAEMNLRLAKGDHFIEDIVARGRPLYGEASWKEDRVCMTGEEPRYAMEWIVNAERDMRLVNLILTSEEDPYGAGFHLQQAIEKALKAFLIFDGWRLERIHDLETLLNAALAYDEGLERFRRLCKEASEYYLVDRYPDPGRVGPGIAEIRENMTVAQELVAHAREIIDG